MLTRLGRSVEGPVTPMTSETSFDDEFDPLAPPEGGLSSPDDPGEDDLLAAPSYLLTDDEDVDDDDSDGGFSDPERVVRIWVEDGRLTKVRVSPIWFHKVPDAAALQDRFRMALMRSTLRVAAIPEDSRRPEIPEEAAEAFRALPSLSRRSLALMRSARREMAARHSAALAEHDPPAPAPAVSGRSKGVTVTLNSAGWAVGVEFDPKWLDDAQVGAICTHVMIAAERAYARYEPVQQVDELREEIAVERELMRTAMLVLFKPHDKRR